MIKNTLTIMIMLSSIIVSKAQSDDPTTWKYFFVVVKESDDNLFKKLSEELGLGINDKDEFDIEFNRGSYGDYVLGGLYQIVVNITDDNIQNRYLVVGDVAKNVEYNSRSLRYPWNQFSKKTQDGLMSWNKENKIKLENKIGIKEEFNNPKTWKYFKILARAVDDSIFLKLQDDMGIDPKLESFTIVVNIMDNNPINQFIVLGDEIDPNSVRYMWSHISTDVQKGLINWADNNKENLYFYEDYNTKIEQFNILIKSNPKYTKLYYLYYLRGNYFKRVGEYEKAIKDYNNALALKPDFEKVYIDLGKAYHQINKFDKSIENYNNYIEGNPDNIKVYGYRGEAYFGNKKYKEAIKDFKYVIKKDPGYTFQKFLYQSYIKEAEEKMK